MTRAAPPPIRTVGVVGAGTMGGGIAQKMAMEGARVVLVDQGEAFLEKARRAVAGLLEEGQKRRVLRPEDARATLERMKFTSDLAELKDADLVIEAIYEDEKAKKDLFSRLDAIAGPEAIFASNTSSLSVAELARATRRPSRFLGMHFFFHPVKNRLVEVVPIGGTDPAALAAVLAFARSTGKTPIEVRDSPGFAVNRFFVPWLNEAVRMLEDKTAGMAAIDAAAERAFGIGMGPFALMNATGVSIACHAAEGLGRALGAFYAPAQLLKKQTGAGVPWPASPISPASAGTAGLRPARPASPISPASAGTARLDAVAERLWGVVFWVAACLAAEGGATREDIDRGARIGLRWARGPFEEMNRIGVAVASDRVRKVCRRHSLGFPAGLQERSGKDWELRYVETIKEDGVARVVLNRPETLNALDEFLAAQLLAAVSAVQADSEVRGIVLEGRGKAFMAGADVKFFARSMEAGDLDGIVRFTRTGQDLLRRIETSAKPVVALVDGAALGGGMELALACRARVVTPKAVFRLPETSLGIYPGLGGTQRLPRLIGKELAKFYILTGAPLGADDAAALGLADAALTAEEALERAKRLAGSGAPQKRPEPGPGYAKVREAFSDGRIGDLLAGKPVDEADPALAKTLRGLAKKAPLALKTANELIDAGLRVGFEEGLALELGRIREIFQTQDAREGLAALLERRAPAFTGR